MRAPGKVSHLSVDRSTVGNITHARLVGAIDETFDPRVLTQKVEQHLIIDLGRLQRMSSFGVRTWMGFTRQLPPGVQGIYLVNVQLTFVDQLSLVEGLAGVAQVLSILAPYACDKCQESCLRLIDMRASEALLRKAEPPPFDCQTCHTPLRFADQPAEFFAFARNLTVSGVNPSVDRYLRSFTNTPKLQSALKVVEGNITYIRLAGTLGSDLNVRRLGGGLEGKVVYDFGQVTEVEPNAEGKLIQMLEAASQQAAVRLWRVPATVLEVLSRRAAPPSVKLLTLMVEHTCKTCGERTPMRVFASAFVRAAAPQNKPCATCGGEAVPTLPAGLTPVVAHLGADDTAVEEIEAIEPRAMSQYLRLLAGPRPNGPANSSESGSQPGPGSDPARGSSELAPSEAAGPENLQMLRRIGQGGMAEVFLARQSGLRGFEKFVVVKKILPQFASEPEFVDMLFAEARSAACLTHQNIVQTYDVGMHSGRAYISMEYVRGPDLRRLTGVLKRTGKLIPIEHVLRICAEVAAALQYAHSYVDPGGTARAIVHRDVSPHNILVSMDGTIKLSDFGIAKAIGESEQTQPGVLKGKLAYVSPEAVRGMMVDGRSDVFSLGSTMYELLTSRTPFKRENEASTLRAIAVEPMVDPRELNPDIPAAVVAILKHTLEKEPERRYHAEQLRAALEEVMASQNLRSTPADVAAFFLAAAPELISQVVPSPPAAPSSSDSFPEISLVMTEVGVPSDQPPPPPAGTPQRGSQISKVPSRVGTPRPPVDLSAPRARSGEGSRDTPPRGSGAFPRAAPRTPRPPTVNLELTPIAAPPPGVAGPRPRGFWVRRLRPWMLWGGAGVVVALGALIFLMEGTSRTLDVRNLESDERLYVDAVRAESGKVRANASGRQTIAVAREGALRRYGMVAGTLVDVLKIPDVRVAPGERAPLTVSSDPRGCSVTVDGAHMGPVTPLSTSIEAGRELIVEVLCPGLPRWRRWVLAAPGQSVEISARMFDENP